MMNTQKEVKKPIIYFLTEDVSNKKEIAEIQILRNSARVILITPQSCPQNTLGLHQLRIKALSPLLERLYRFWLRLSFLLCRLAPSAGDVHFPIRNIYQRNRVAKWIVNLIWRIKKISLFNSLLPSYDTLFFFPARILGATCSSKLHQRCHQRLFVHDALLVRLHRFAPFIARIRAQGGVTVANVKSWDNPFYTQLTTRCNGYIVWSDSMARDIQATHSSAPKKYIIWGARPFQSILMTSVRWEGTQTEKQSGLPEQFVLGYAAAFCDPIMASHEVGALARLAAELQIIAPGCIILLRPYPTLPLKNYERLSNLNNIEIADITGPLIDRYGDGRETIKFGSDLEKLQFLARCNAFLSLATSFTIEAAIADIPIIQYMKHPSACLDSDEHAVFSRIEISDHLCTYYNQDLHLATSAQHIAERMEQIKTNNFDRSRQRSLLTRLGATPTLLLPEAGPRLQSAIQQFFEERASKCEG